MLLAMLGLGTERTDRMAEVAKAAKRANEAAEGLTETLQAIVDAPGDSVVELVKRARGTEAFGEGPDKVDRRREPR